jgi:hypothetical protein
MLTPHEIALLLVTRDAPYLVDLGNKDFAVLVEQKLIHVEPMDEETGKMALTSLGVRTVERLRGLSLS